MCGRYRLTEPQKFAELNDIRLGSTLWGKRYNIAPTQKILTVLDENPHEFTETRWGLIPTWARDRKIASQCINAKAETVAEKPSFRSAFKKRRCLIPADGFFEWQVISKSLKQPYNIGLKENEPFAFAGLWESWNDPETKEKVLTCSIITTIPNELTAPIHDRMPVILPPERRKAWLAADIPAEQLKSFLVPFPAERMAVYKIAPRVGSPKFDDEKIIERIEEQGTLL